MEMQLKIFSLFIVIFFLCSCVTVGYQEEMKPNIKNEAAKSQVRLALALLEQNYLPAAKATLLYALQLDGKESAVWYTLAYYHEVVGEVKLAENEYKQAIYFEPQRGAAHNNYATFLYRQGRYRMALVEFLQATQDLTYVDVANAYEGAGLCAAQQFNSALAKKFFKQACQHDPKKFHHYSAQG